MIAEKNDTLREASESLYTLNADRLIRQQCQAREDYYKWQNIKNHKIETLTSENTALTSKVDELTATLEEQEKLIQALQKQLAETNK